MKTPEYRDYIAARTALTSEDFTKTGAPKMKAINAALAELGFPKIENELRDHFERQIDAGFEAPDDGMVTITLHSAPSNPVSLYVHGVGGFTLRVGEEHTLPADAVAALGATSAQFTVKE